MPTFTNNETSTADGTGATSVVITAVLADAAVCACATEDPFNVDFSTSATAAFTDAVTQIIGYNDSTTGAASASAAINAATGEAKTSTAVASDAAVLSLINGTTDTAAASDTAVFTVDSFASSTAVATDTPAFTPVASRAASEVANATDAVEIIVVVNVTDTANSTDTNKVVLDVGVVDSGVAAETATPSASAYANVSSFGAFTDATTSHTVAVLSLVSTVIARSFASFPSSSAFWTNGETEAAATWSNVPFNSFAMHGGQLYAAGPGGIYAFDTTKDVGVNITASVSGDLMDFGDEHLKRYPSAYVAASGTDPMRLTVTTERATGSYDTIDQSFSGATNHRALIGRGLTGRFARMTLSNINGGELDAKSVDIAVSKMHRRV